jgi:hypothetical protein
VTLLPTRGEQRRADALGGDPCLEARVLVTEQVARREVGHGDVTVEEPAEDGGSGHRLIVTVGLPPSTDLG